MTERQEKEIKQMIHDITHDIKYDFKKEASRVISKQKEPYLKEILESEVFKNASSPLTMALGKDIVGAPFVTDLKKLPHLLIAGTTGSGKSVGINAMLLSLLYRNSPQTLRLMMIDPKMLELI